EPNQVLRETYLRHLRRLCSEASRAVGSREEGIALLAEGFRPHLAITGYSLPRSDEMGEAGLSHADVLYVQFVEAGLPVVILAGGGQSLSDREPYRSAPPVAVLSVEKYDETLIDRAIDAYLAWRNAAVATVHLTLTASATSLYAGGQVSLTL